MSVRLRGTSKKSRSLDEVVRRAASDDGRVVRVDLSTRYAQLRVRDDVMGTLGVRMDLQASNLRPAA